MCYSVSVSFILFLFSFLRGLFLRKIVREDFFDVKRKWVKNFFFFQIKFSRSWPGFFFELKNFRREKKTFCLLFGFILFLAHQYSLRIYKIRKEFSPFFYLTLNNVENVFDKEFCRETFYNQRHLIKPEAITPPHNNE